jgi:Cu(I)/Ag(I) efflux system periplasmic protein CusF
MTMRKYIAAFFLASIAVGLPASAQTPPAKPPTASSSAVSSGDSVEGEVRKVDKDAKKITLKHGPIPNLEMTGMTMVFRVKDPAMLDAVKVGDKVRFKADRIQGAITITEIKPAG